MTMFSMKPKFDLAEFLAEPARAGTRGKPRQFHRSPPRKTEVDEKSSDSDE